jgi:hypothetical protein
MRRHHRFVSLFFALAVSATPAMHASSSICDAISGNLIANCGFEGSTYIFPSGVFSEPTGWGASNFDFTFVSAGDPNSGANSLAFANFSDDGPAVASQTFSDTSGGALDFTFYVANAAPGISGELFQASFDGTTLLNLDGSADSADYTEYSYSVVGTGSDTISFAGYNNASGYLLDDVSVVETPSAVPEPSSIVLLGTGVLSLAGAARRRFPSPSA